MENTKENQEYFDDGFNGPWQLDRENPLQINDCTGEAVAYTETCIGHRRDLLNARLIAEAPHLLYCLERLVEAAEMYANYAGRDFIATYAREAIARVSLIVPATARERKEP